MVECVGIWHALFLTSTTLQTTPTTLTITDVWIGGTGADLRSKTKILNKLPEKIEDYPVWNYDGSSTGQAPGDDSEVFLVARAVYKDPFRGGDNVLVLCDTYEPPRTKPDGTVVPMKALPTNTRCACAEAMDKAKAEEPWFGTWGLLICFVCLCVFFCPILGLLFVFLLSLFSSRSVHHHLCFPLHRH